MPDSGWHSETCKNPSSEWIEGGGMVKPNRIEPIIREYRDQLTRILGEALEAVVLYGSHAREDAQEGSDIDILCVMRLPFDYGTLIRNTAEAAARISPKYDVAISTAFALSEEYQTRNTSFLMNARHEGVTV
jgi:predicted nucleotidyltransferase